MQYIVKSIAWATITMREYISLYINYLLSLKKLKIWLWNIRLKKTGYKKCYQLSRLNGTTWINVNINTFLYCNTRWSVCILKRKAKPKYKSSNLISSE